MGGEPGGPAGIGGSIKGDRAVAGPGAKLVAVSKARVIEGDNDRATEALRLWRREALRL